MANVTYELDQAAADLIAEMFAQIKAAEVGISTVLAYYARQNGIKGMVKLGEDRRSIEVVSAPGQAQPQMMTTVSEDGRVSAEEMQ